MQNTFTMDIDKIYLERCLGNESKAQEILYRHYAPKMLALCVRYSKSREEAEDILQEGFIKVFTKLDDFRNEGSLEGWIRRIMINTALNSHKKKSLLLQDINPELFEQSRVEQPLSLDYLSAEELRKVIAGIPNPYQLVFNLNAIEGYTHKEIGEMLHISTNTSKSRLNRARNIIQKRYLQIHSVSLSNSYDRAIA